MPRKKNAAQGVPFSVTISEQSVEVLKRLARLGSYGRNAPEVGGRLLEQVITDRFTKERRYDLEKIKRR